MLQLWMKERTGTRTIPCQHSQGTNRDSNREPSESKSKSEALRAEV
jgi:hypothetical protein